MKILIAADHGGYQLKEKIELHYDVREDMPDSRIVDIVDLGPQELDPQDDYPDFAFKLAEQLVAIRAEREQDLMTDPLDTDYNRPEETLGILICRSGNGMAIAANKVKGARAALCFTPEHAKKAREHDYANILVLDADYLSEDEHLQIVHEFIHAQPDPHERHRRRVNKITTYENN